MKDSLAALKDSPRYEVEQTWTRKSGTSDTEPIGCVTMDLDLGGPGAGDDRLAVTTSDVICFNGDRETWATQIGDRLWITTHDGISDPTGSERGVNDRRWRQARLDDGVDSGLSSSASDFAVLVDRAKGVVKSGVGYSKEYHANTVKTDLYELTLTPEDLKGMDPQAQSAASSSDDPAVGVSCTIGLDAQKRLRSIHIGITSGEEELIIDAVYYGYDDTFKTEDESVYSIEPPDDDQVVGDLVDLHTEDELKSFVTGSSK